MKLSKFLTSGLWVSSFAKAAGQREIVTFRNDQRLLFDVDGRQIDAYAAKVNYFGMGQEIKISPGHGRRRIDGKYYLYGISFASPTSNGINAYSSIDLKDWKFEGPVFDSDPSNPCNGLGGCGRPHIIYNPSTEKYVFWGNSNRPSYAVATSSSPVSGYTFSDATPGLDPRFDAFEAADAAVESFGTKGYLIWSALDFQDPRAGSIWSPIYQTLHISPLTADFTNTTLQAYNVSSVALDLVDQQAESPDMFIRNNTYYVVASDTCGFCNGSIAVVSRSQSLEGPWTRQIISGFSCNGQVEGILPLTNPDTNETSYVWHSTTTPGGPRVSFSGHIFQPLQFNSDGSVKDLDCSTDAKFEVGFTRGIGAAANGKAVIASDGSPRFADYQPVCDSDRFFTVFQTWTSSKTGTLKEVAVNIAGGGQNIGLVVKVFRFGSISDLVSPGYKYTLLGSAKFNGTALAQTFDTTSVLLDTQVNEGDNLGFSIAEDQFLSFSIGNLIPYCHLEYSLDSISNATQGMVLLQQGSGQNSLRGKNGDISPVWTRAGKGIKFHAIVG